MSSSVEKSPKSSICVSYKARSGKTLGTTKAQQRQMNKIHSYAHETRSPAGQQTFQVWPEREKRALLEAMKQYGHYDLDNLCKALPGKSKDNIRMAIAMWWKAARLAILSSSTGNKNPEKLTKPKKAKVPLQTSAIEKAPIDQWLHKLEQNQPLGGHMETKLLAKVFLYISKFEKHPSPMECNGMDYKALYEYLYCMLNGYPGKDLNQATSLYLLKSLNDIASKIRERGRDKETDFLTKYPRMGTVRQYGGKKKQLEADAGTVLDSTSTILIMKKLLEVPGFNPLKVPLDLTKK